MSWISFVLPLFVVASADGGKPIRKQIGVSCPFVGKWISNGRLGALGGLVVQVKDGKWMATRLVSGPDDGLIPIATVALRPLRDETSKGRVCGFAVFRIAKSVTYTVVWREKGRLIAEEVIIAPSNPGADRRVRFVLKPLLPIRRK